MGWASGSDLAEDVWMKVREYVPAEARDDVAFQVFDLFCDEDADDWREDMRIVRDSKRVRAILEGE